MEGLVGSRGWGNRKPVLGPGQKAQGLPCRPCGCWARGTSAGTPGPQESLLGEKGTGLPSGWGITRWKGARGLGARPDHPSGPDVQASRARARPAPTSWKTCASDCFARPAGCGAGCFTSMGNLTSHRGSGSRRSLDSQLAGEQGTGGRAAQSTLCFGGCLQPAAPSRAPVRRAHGPPGDMCWAQLGPSVHTCHPPC